jgi:hypothetical protein
MSRGWRASQSLLWGLAASVCAAWLLARAGQTAAAGLGAVPLVGLLAWALLPGREAVLAWDGEQWRLEATPVRVTVALDFGAWLLLRLDGTEAPASRRWLPATAAQAGMHWHALRAALYSRAPEATLAAAPPHGASAPD